MKELQLIDTLSLFQNFENYKESSEKLADEYKSFIPGTSLADKAEVLNNQMIGLTEEEVKEQ